MRVLVQKNPSNHTRATIARCAKSARECDKGCHKCRHLSRLAAKSGLFLDIRARTTPMAQLPPAAMVTYNLGPIAERNDISVPFVGT